MNDDTRKNSKTLRPNPSGDRNERLVSLSGKLTDIWGAIKEQQIILHLRPSIWGGFRSRPPLR